MSWVDCILNSARNKLLSDYRVVNFLLQSEREKEEWAELDFEPKWQAYESGTRHGCEFWIHGFLAMGPWRILTLPSSARRCTNFASSLKEFADCLKPA